MRAALPSNPSHSACATDRHHDPKPTATNTNTERSLNRGVVPIFSIVIAAPSAAIQTTFITPTANITASSPSSSQDKEPCRNPSRNTPRGSVVQLAKKNGNGRWHCVTQACFSAEN